MSGLVVEGLLPQLEREQPPDLASVARLALEAGEDLAVVHQLALLRRA